MLYGCRNDMEAIRSLDITDTIPQMSARDIEILYSEQGYVQIKLTSPHLISFDGEDPYMEFPEGFTAYFYDTAFHVTSTISADYGISHEKTKIMEARHNVVVENIGKSEKLNTEELFWDRNKETIFTDKFVKITRGEEVITGDGLTSDQNFVNIAVKNPKGLIEVKDTDKEF